MIKQNQNLFFKAYKHKLIILIVGLIVRVFVGMVFWGSIDIIASMANSLVLFNGEHIEKLPYFPIIPAFIWLGGLINLIPSIPITFGYKVVPIIFDIMTALLIYDFLRRKEKRYAFKVGLLYALSPVSIILTCIHGQWDSIFLFILLLAFYIREFYKDTNVKYFTFGALFCLSIMVKPVPLMFLLYFFTSFSKFNSNGLKKYMTYQLSSICGFVSVGIISFAAFAAFGYDLVYLVKYVLSYSNNGVVIFGLPLFPLFESIEFFKHRIWIMVLLVLISLFYYWEKIKLFDMLLISFALVIGFSGLSPQYLVWLVPFLLITGKIKISAVYSFVSTVFLMLYYINPKVSNIPEENMATLATLKPFKWLMPPDLFLEDKFIPIIHFIGNCLIPACAIFIVVYGLVSSIKSNSGEQPKDQDRIYVFYKDKYLIVISLIGAVIAILYAVFNRLSLYDKLNQYINNSVSGYNLIMKGNNVWGTYPSESPINIIYIMFLGSIVWGIFAFVISKYKRYELRDN